MPPLPASIDTGDATVSRAHDGVLEVRWRDGTAVDAPMMRRVIAAQVALAGVGARVWVDARNVRTMSRDAQQLSAHQPDHPPTAVAIVTSGPVSIVLGNFFLTISRPPYPSRLFDHPDTARAWLLEQSQ